MARGGARAGAGAKLGSKHKSTIERMELARQVEQANKPPAERTRLAKDFIEDMMKVAAGYASMYQPGKPKGDEKKFKEWAKLTVEWASELAPYQSPTFKAIALREVPPEKPAVDPKVLSMDAGRDEAQITDTYLRLIRADPKAAA